MRFKIIALLLFSTLILSTANETNNTVNNGELRRKVPGFFFSMPKNLLAGRNETVCVTVHHASPSRISVDLKIRNKHYFTSKTLNTEHSCFEISVPNEKLKEAQIASVRVQIQLDGVLYSSHNQDPILVYPSKELTFVETDRGIYKAGDVVKIRILTLADNLLPPANYTISTVRIRNPFGITVAVWENISSEMGLTQIAHHLSKDSIEGKWKIDVNDDTTKNFEVTRYVLPRFNVKIHHPKVIHHKVDSVTIKVCSWYAYGANVKGTAFLRLLDSHNNMKPLQSIQKIVDGCAIFNFSNDDLALWRLEKLYALIDPKISLQITATVTEYGTDKIELSKAKSLISLNAFTLHFDANDEFQPGLVYPGRVLINNVNTDLNGHVVEICYNVAIKKSWNYLNNEQCFNRTLTSNQVDLEFQVLPLKSNIVHMHLTARSVNHTIIGASFTAIRQFSPSSNYIRITSNNNKNCGGNHEFNVAFTTDNIYVYDENITLFYIIKSRGQIVKLRKIVHPKSRAIAFTSLPYKLGNPTKFTAMPSHTQTFTIKFRPDDRIISSFQILVYHIPPTGEIIANSMNIEIEPCLRNIVNVSWVQQQVLPGEKASLKIEASSDSLCSISAIDKSMKFIDHATTLNKDLFYRPFLKERETPESDRKKCVPPTKSKKPAALTEEDEDWGNLRRRRKRYVFPYAEDVDSYEILNKFGTVTITNFRVVTKSCYTGPRSYLAAPMASITDQYDVHNQNEDKVAPIRSFFPETWLWELVPVRKHNNIERDIPHTITKWETNAICISETEGVGFSNTVEITAFQPFFVDVITPYSIKQGEVLYLHVMIFNYLNYNLPIRVTLNQSSFELVDSFSRNTVSFCIASNASNTHIFELKPTQIGTMNLTVVAEIDTNYPGQCGPDIVVNKRDVVSKTIRIEPEGYSKSITKSALICATDHSSGNITWNLQVPENVVPESSNAKIIINGDLLGQTIENLDELITIPTGCGEQIMASLAPNLYALQYLNTTKNLTPMTRQKIIKNLKIGCQRILNYVHRDGSFSAFGYHDPMGSMFLTAFVVRTLRDVKQHVYVNQHVIEKAVAWIYEHQLENGCFNTMLHVFQDMGGTSNENSTAGLTAYVVISLLDADIAIPERVQTNAKYCIRGYYHLDKYTLAISSYALLKLKLHHEAARMLHRLIKIAYEKDNMMWWSARDDRNTSTASDVEITSYVLFAMLEYRTQENLAYAHAIVRWLSSRQGSKGGFKSTQDTVVALAALTKYWQYFAKPTNINITLNAINQHHSFSIKNKDRLKSRKVVLKEAANQVNIRIDGNGCVLVQAVQSYYMKQLPVGKAFKLEVEAASVSTVDKCSIAMLTPCFMYDGPETHANMAVLEMDLPSGYDADRASLYRLLDDDKFTNVKMFEEGKNKVVLYLTKLDHQQICIHFNINENTIVQARTESVVKLYDYYKPEYSVLQFYKLNECESLNSTIPQLVMNNENETTKNMEKRETGNNPDFVDMDVDLSFPDGMEGVSPTYIKPNFTVVDLNVTNSIENVAKSIKKRDHMN